MRRRIYTRSSGGWTYKPASNGREFWVVLLVVLCLSCLSMMAWIQRSLWTYHASEDSSTFER